MQAHKKIDPLCRKGENRYISEADLASLSSSLSSSQPSSEGAVIFKTGGGAEEDQQVPWVASLGLHHI